MTKLTVLFFAAASLTTLVAFNVTDCPQGWRTSTSGNVAVYKTGQSGGNYQRKQLVARVPETDVVTKPMFCFHDNKTNWECWLTVPSIGRWFRFDSYAVQKQEGAEVHAVVAQNESHDTDRVAQLVVCYHPTGRLYGEINVRPAK